jgi:hypothetical protein
MRKKTPKRKSKSADSLLKTRVKRDIELTEQELGKVSGGGAGAGDLSATVKFKFTTTTKDKIDTY